MFTGLLSEEGHLFLCGGGSVVPPYLSAANLDDGMNSDDDDARDQDDIAEAMDEDEDDDEGNGAAGESEDGAASKERKVAARKELLADRKLRRAERRQQTLVDSAVVVKTPRRPSASWLYQLSSRRIASIAGRGTRMFALLVNEFIKLYIALASNIYTLKLMVCISCSPLLAIKDEEIIAHSFTHGLLRRTLLGAAAGGHGHGSMEDLSLESQLRSGYGSGDDTSVGSYFEAHGRADCLIVASGKVRV